MSVKKYPLATEEREWVYTPITKTTNCVDKIGGHSYEWIFKDNPLHDEILAEYPRDKGFGICLCRKCNKVTFST